MEYALLTKKGNREYNEDFVGYVCTKNCFCFVLADGLGGHGKGEIASKCVVSSIIADFEELEECFHLDQAIERAQNRLSELQKQNNCHEGMKTTIVVLYVNREVVQWGHIGDSRLYFWKNKRIVTRTLDHSVPQMLVLAKEIKEKDIRFHEDRNRLLKAMGNEDDRTEPEISRQFKRRRGQAFLMCSDGFWELIDEEEMRREYKYSANPQEWIDRMEKIICENGSSIDMDNYSAIAVWI